MANFAMTRDFVRVLLHFEPKLDVGESIEFYSILHCNRWDFKLTREDERYYPHRYILEGTGGQYGTWSRRYRTMEQAFLHILNNLNENKNIRNRYKTIRCKFSIASYDHCNIVDI